MCTAFLIAACDPGGDPHATGTNAADTTTVRDSAGVAIVENPARNDTLMTREVLRIGRADGDDRYTLFRVANIAVDAGGAFYVAMTDGIRVFASDGSYVRSIGARGQGPGEFAMAPIVWFAGDTVVAVDRNLMRTTAFDSAGRVLTTLAGTQSGMWILPRASNGRAWVAEVEPMSDLEERPRRLDVPRGARHDPPPIALLRYDPASESFGDTLYRVPRPYVVGSPQAEGGLARPLFTVEPMYGFDGAGNHYRTSAEAYRIDVFDANGTHVRSIRRAYEPVPILDSDVDVLPQTLAEGWLASAELINQTPDQYLHANLPRFREMVARLVAAAPLPDARAPLGSIMISLGGAIAVERSDALTPAVRHTRRITGWPLAATRWDRFDRAGRYNGTFELPPEFRPRALLDNGSIVGVLRDSVGVEYVVTLALSRTAPAAAH